jgi:hypothetical protein
MVHDVIRNSERLPVLQCGLHAAEVERYIEAKRIRKKVFETNNLFFVPPPHKTTTHDS